jgi:pyruvate dehydrogenase E2 component (dihydrolipoamide acetyltransferase)
MAISVIMPRQGQSVESCIITKWHKEVGEQVNVGDVLFSYETDKASFEEESPVSGTFLAKLFEDGDDVPCLQKVCIIGNEGESLAEFAESTAEVAEVSVEIPTQTATQTIDETTGVQDSTPSNSDRVSPRAKSLATKLGIDVHHAQATGPNGRVIERDILLLKEQGVFATSAARLSGEAVPASGTGMGGRAVVADLNQKLIPEVQKQALINVPNGFGYRDEKVANIRKVIAKAMQTSLTTTAQLTLNSSFDASEILQIRAKLKKSKVDFNVTLTDMILFAVSRVLKDYPDLNAHFLGDMMRYFDQVHLGLAVDTERGLLVPTIFNADQKSLVQISNDVKALVEMSKIGTINPDLLSGASFTITNLGTFGIESFTPIINPPQTGILGVNTIVTRVKDEGGVISTYPAMGLSLTFDHRALDGAPAARFLEALVNALENFSILLMQ